MVPSGLRVQDHRRGWHLIGLCACVMHCAAVAQTETAADARSYSLGRQSLADALRGLARASGQQVLFREQDVANTQSAGLSGRYTVPQALQALLRDAGLAGRKVADRTFIIEPAVQRPPPVPAVRRRPTPRPIPAPAAEPDPNALGTIVVTARRYPESIQHTPVAVSQISGADLRRAGVENLQDLDGLIPGVGIIEGNGGISGLFVRNVGQDDFLISSDPGVGTYLDGVYLGRIFGSALETLDLDRIEVLRGPQGTLYGRNSEAGTINVLSNLPSATFEGSSQLWIGTRNRVDASGIMNVPLTSSSALRFAAKARRQDGYIKNLSTEGDAGNIDRQSARLSFKWDAPSGTRVLLSGDYSRQRERGNGYNFVSVSAANNPNILTQSKIEFWNRVVAPAIGERPVDNSYKAPMRTTRSTMGLQSDFDHWGISLTLEGGLGGSGPGEGGLGGGRWKSISAYRQVASAWGADYDRTPASMWIASVPTARQYQLSEELQLTAGAGMPLRYTAGLFVFREVADDRHVAGLPIGAMDVLERSAPHSIAAPGHAGLACPNPDPDVNLSYCLGGSRQAAPEAFARAVDLQLGAPIHSARQVSSLSAAMYGQLGFAPSPAWEIAAGVRASYEAKKVAYADFTPSSGVTRGGARNLEWVVPTWSLTLSHQPADDRLYYLTWSRGYKAGGVNLRPLQGEFHLDGYDPEINSNIEAGFKSEWWKNRIRLNVAAYFEDYSKFQDFTYSVSGEHLVSTFSNRADAIAFGVEAELDVAFTREFLLQASMAHQEWRYDHFSPEGSDALRLGQPQPRLLPATTARAVLKWNKDLSAGRLTTQADVRWRSGLLLFFGITSTDGAPSIVTKVREPPSAQVAWGASFAPNASPWEYFLEIDNLLGRAARINYFRAAVVAELWNKPREWRMGLRRRF